MFELLLLHFKEVIIQNNIKKILHEKIGKRERAQFWSPLSRGKRTNLGVIYFREGFFCFSSVVDL